MSLFTFSESLRWILAQECCQSSTTRSRSGCWTWSTAHGASYAQRRWATPRSPCTTRYGRASSAPETYTAWCCMPRDWSTISTSNTLLFLIILFLEWLLRFMNDTSIVLEPGPSTWERLGHRCQSITSVFSSDSPAFHFQVTMSFSKSSVLWKEIAKHSYMLVCLFIQRF